MTLIERLEKAGEGSRELDAAIWYAIHEPDVDYPGIRTEQTEQGPREVLTCELGSKWADDVGQYSTSLDAALALAERVLPGWSWMVRHYASGHGGPGWTAYVCQPENDTINSGPVKSTPALALCLAILRATQEQPNV